MIEKYSKTTEFKLTEPKHVKNINEVEVMAEQYFNSNPVYGKIFIVVDKDWKFKDRIIAGPFVDMEYVILDS